MVKDCFRVGRSIAMVETVDVEHHGTPSTTTTSADNPPALNQGAGLLIAANRTRAG
jgi:hypothetical protein